jgi:hypothetical protein
MSSPVKAAMSPPFAKSPTRRSTKSHASKEKTDTGEFDGEASFSRTLSLAKSLSHIDFDDSGPGEENKRDYNLLRKKYNKVAKMSQDLRETYGEDKAMRQPLPGWWKSNNISTSLKIRRNGKQRKGDKRPRKQKIDRERESSEEGLSGNRSTTGYLKESSSMRHNCRRMYQTTQRYLLSHGV